MNYGVNFNASYVMNGDDIELGIHAKDSDGVEVSTKVNGDSIDDVLAAAMEDIINGVQEQRDEKDDAADDVSRLKEQNARLQARVEQLQKELNVKNSSKADTPKTRYAVLDDLQDVVNDTVKKDDLVLRIPKKDKSTGAAIEYNDNKTKRKVDSLDELDEILNKLFGEYYDKKSETKAKKPERKQSWKDVKYQMSDKDRIPRTLWF